MRTESVQQVSAMDATARKGWPILQQKWVDRIKRAALRHLHASAAGEALVLRIYLCGEEATELTIPPGLDTAAAACPDWLRRQIEHHLEEEKGHARAFAAALAERGASAAGLRPDLISRWKIARWHAISHRYHGQFGAGPLVAAYAVGLCAEQMACRVLQRHCEVLDTRNPLYPLLTRVLGDEQRHVRLCRATLMRLTAPDEGATLARLMAELRRVEWSFAVTAALGMYVAALGIRLFRPGGSAA